MSESRVGRPLFGAGHLSLAGAYTAIDKRPAPNSHRSLTLLHQDNYVAVLIPQSIFLKVLMIFSVCNEVSV